MLKYVIMTDYGGYEGWKINGETDDFNEAVKLRDAFKQLGTETFIFKPVELIITEKE